MTPAAQQMAAAFDGLVAEQNKIIADSQQDIVTARVSIKAARKEIKRLVNQRARVLAAPDSASPVQEVAKVA